MSVKIVGWSLDLLSPAMRLPATYVGRKLALGGPLATTQSIEKFFSKHDFGDPNGLLPLGNPSVKVGGFAPRLDGWVSRREEAGWTLKIGF